VVIRSGNSSGGGNAKIGPGDPNAKKNYCSHQADLAALEDLLPGITRGQYVSTAKARSAKNASSQRSRSSKSSTQVKSLTQLCGLFSVSPDAVLVKSLHSSVVTWALKNV